MVEVLELSKTFRVHRRAPGVFSALRSVFHRPTETVTAVQGLSFSIGEGERVGFLGPNGAGKTTTLKILSGLLHPTAGSVMVAGFVPFRRDPAFLKQITLVMGQKQQLLWDLPPTETYAMNRALYEIPRAQADETIRELVAVLEIGDLINKPTRQLSLGERMKCELVAALLHRPRVLFLDEPTIGLDVSMQAKMREFIRHYNERFRAAVILTSHYMDDVTALCPRVIVIDHGKLIYDGDLKALVRRVRPDKRLTVRLSAPIDRALLEKIAPLISYDGGQAVMAVAPERLNATVQNALATLPVVDLAVEDPPLEEVMREMFKGNGSTAVRGDST
ncbi:MAG: ATP-binding cassette domain-containing protein [Deltaproteobacteria bacterium]|nr:ATP-binding cassette domain-containing protein [Deltaproteobacteria bacterium]